MRKHLGKHFNFAVNVLTVIAGLVVIVIALTNHLKHSRKTDSVSTETPSAISERRIALTIPGFDYRGSPRTLAMFLDAKSLDSLDSVPLFTELTNASTSGSFRTVAIFPNEKNFVETSLQSWGWAVEHRSGAKLRDYRVRTLPAVLLIDQQGVILKSWSGEISSAHGVEIKTALGLSVPRFPRSLAPISESTFQTYDEHQPLRTVELPGFLEGTNSSLAKYQDPQYKEINVFDVDNVGNLYFTYQEHIVKVDASGRVVKSRLMPKGFQFGYCVDAQGDSYLYLRSKEILVWSPELGSKDVIKLQNVIGGRPIIAKMAVDRRNQQLYLQTYEGVLKEQTLYRIDLRSHESSVVYQLKNSPKAVPTYGPGIFDWSIGGDLLFVSDAADYKITTYSLKDAHQIQVFDRPFVRRQIHPEDSRLQSVGRDLTYVLKPGAMVNYPAIWKVSATEDDKLLVFTGERDSSNRQVVHVYDKDFQFLGTDLKYFRPGLNNHLVAGDLIYVADLHDDRKAMVSDLSPLDTPALAHKLKIFRSRLK